MPKGHTLSVAVGSDDEFAARNTTRSHRRADLQIKIIKADGLVANWEHLISATLKQVGHTTGPVLPVQKDEGGGGVGSD